MSANVPRAVLPVLCVLVGAVVVTWFSVRLAARLLAGLGQVLLFAIEPLDALVTAGLGIAPVLPRMRRWWLLVAAEWRARRSGAIDAEVIDAEVVEGVWR